jgi:hypothetical protein
MIGRPIVAATAVIIERIAKQPEVLVEHYLSHDVEHRERREHDRRREELAHRHIAVVDPVQQDLGLVHFGRRSGHAAGQAEKSFAQGHCLG